MTTNSGDNNGFEVTPAGACAPGGAEAVDNKSGTASNTTCGDVNADRHTFRDFEFSLPADASVTGIEVRLDAYADSSNNSPVMCVELSWDNGGSWTAAQTGPVLNTVLTTYILGSQTDTWGHWWTGSELNNGSFRVRITNTAARTDRDFHLDWVAARVTYVPAPAPAPTPTPIPTATPFFSASLVSTADSFVDQAQPALNFGADSTMRVDSQQRSFLVFDPSIISPGATVTSATLTLCFPADPGAAAGRTHELRRVTSAWTESGVTWNNQPAVAASPTATTAVPATAQCVSADVTADVQAWVSGAPNYGWRSADADEATALPALYASREYATPSQRPLLDVTYTP